MTPQSNATFPNNAKPSRWQGRNKIRARPLVCRLMNV